MAGGWTNQQVDVWQGLWEWQDFSPHHVLYDGLRSPEQPWDLSKWHPERDLNGSAFQEGKPWLTTRERCGLGKGVPYFVRVLSLWQKYHVVTLGNSNIIPALLKVWCIIFWISPPPIFKCMSFTQLDQTTIVSGNLFFVCLFIYWVSTQWCIMNSFLALFVIAHFWRSKKYLSDFLSFLFLIIFSILFSPSPF